MFQKRVVLITGASSGIGSALARELARQGAKVGLLARREPELRELAESIRSAGGTAAYAVADVTDRAGLGQAVAQLEAELGPTDLLVANAGVAQKTMGRLPTAAEMEELFRVNVFGVVNAIDAVLPGMLARGRGHLAAVSSLASYKGLPGQPSYSASKAAVNTYMEGLRIRYKPKGLAVTTICPGFIQTPMTTTFRFKLPLLLTAEQAARRIARALAARKAVYNFPFGTAFMVKLSQWMPDWLVYRATRRQWEHGLVGEEEFDT